MFFLKITFVNQNVQNYLLDKIRDQISPVECNRLPLLIPVTNAGCVNWMRRPRRKTDIFKQTYRCCSHISQQTTKIKTTVGHKTNTYACVRARVFVVWFDARGACIHKIYGKKTMRAPRNLLQSLSL